MIAIQIDDQTHDLRIKNGGMVIGDVDKQNQFVILSANKGEIKEHPTLGVGIDTYTNDNDIQGLKYAIRTNFKMDGLNLQKVDFQNEKLNIEAYYEQ